MKKRFSVFAAFFTSLCAVCAFLTMVLVLGSMTGCSLMGHTELPPLPSVEPSGQPSAEPSPAPPDGPTLAPEPSQDVVTSEAVTPPPVQSTPAPAPTEAQPSQGTPGNKFYAVLTGSEPFYSTDIGQNLTINELGRAVSSDSGITVKVLKFTCADLDGDGAPEAILWLQIPMGLKSCAASRTGKLMGTPCPIGPSWISRRTEPFPFPAARRTAASAPFRFQTRLIRSMRQRTACPPMIPTMS